MIAYHEVRLSRGAEPPTSQHADRITGVTADLKIAGASSYRDHFSQ